MFRPLVLLVLCGAAFAALPKGWKPCKQSDPEYSDCLSSAITSAIKSLANGDKGLGVLPLEPLRTEKLHIGKGKGPVAIDFTLTKADGYGLKDTEIRGMRNDWKTADIDVYIPRLEILSDYKVDGNVLVLPISGQGKANLTLDKLSINAHVVWKEVTKNNVKYINMESLKLPMVPEKVYINFEGLFNGNKELGDNMNLFLNENWDLILKELQEPISEALGAALMQTSNRILSKIPASEIIQ